MDKSFLEFWGNFFLTAAKGQEQLENLSKWMGQGLTGSDDLTAMFRKSYGLDRLNPNDPKAASTLEAAAENFQQSFRTYLGYFDVVPGAEYRALQEEHERLQEKVATLTEKIRTLQQAIGEGGEDITGGFGALIERQAEEFKALTDTFQEFFTAASDPKKE